MTTEVLIVGAGPSGLVLALQLARRGIRFRIVEKHAGPGEASRALVVHARILEFYAQLGFAEEAVANGIPLEGIRIRKDQREVARASFRNLGEGLSPFPFALIWAQDDHERFLVEKLRGLGIAVEWGTELMDFRSTANGVEAHLRGAGRDEQVSAAYIAGCDGAHSRVRQVVGLGFPGGTYEQPFYVADVHVAEDSPRDIAFNLGVDDFGLRMPVRSRGAQRLIGAVPLEYRERKDLRFEEIQPHVESVLGVRVIRLHWFSTYRVHHRVAEKFRVGRAFIVGDAGHIHSPAGGQGMNTGIGDAVNLAWKLASVLRGRASEEILETYEVERRAFAKVLVASTDRGFQMVVGRGWLSRIIRNWIVPTVMPRALSWAWVRRMMFRTVSQIRVRYPQSALSAGRAGEVRAGDRLPWLGSRDNLRPFTELDWRLQIYGRPNPALADSAHSLGLALDEFPWEASDAHAGFAENAAYLVRPDLYVALALPEQSVKSLESYVRRHGLRFKD